MSVTPISSEEKDPTCVGKMLESLTRKNHKVGHNVGLSFGLGMAGRPTSSGAASLCLGMGHRRRSAVATRLKFDDTMNIERPIEFSSRKRYMESDGVGLLGSVEKKFKVENTESSNVNVPASPWEFRLMKEDLRDARSQIEVLKNRNHQLHALRREQELVFENEKASLKVECDGHMSRVKDLESRMEILKKRKYECKEELEELKGRLNSLNNDSSVSAHALEKRVAEITEQLREFETTAHKNSLAAKQRELRLEIKLATALETCTLQEKEIAELRTKVEEARAEHSQMEMLKQQIQENQLKIDGLESEKEDMKEAAELATSQRQKLLKFPEMERELSSFKEENARLRGLVQNKLFLEEKVSNLELRLASSEERDKEFAHLQARVNCLEVSLNEWLALAKDLGSSAKSPASLRLRFEHLQQRELQLTADSAELKSRLKAVVESKSSLATELEGLKIQLEKQKAINDQQTNFLHRQRKKLTLVSQERDYYRSQLDAYEKDLTISTTTSVLPTSQQEQNRSRIALLEKTLQGFRELVEKLENDISKEKKVGGPSECTEKDQIQALEEERDRLKRENVELTRKRQELELELEYCAMKGDFQPSKTKILHFKNNPRAEAEAQREDELDVLREECNKLRERIRVLGNGQGKDVTLIVEENVKVTHSKEVRGLQEEVSTYKVKMQRLKEAFKKTSNEFREIVYKVLGFKIDWKNTNEYHLSSMYAESQDDILIFQYNSESGDVNMLETPYSTTLKSLIDLHLRRQKSIPVFLSAVTLDLFSQQTMATVTEPITLVE